MSLWATEAADRKEALAAAILPRLPPVPRYIGRLPSQPTDATPAEVWTRPWPVVWIAAALNALIFIDSPPKCAHCKERHAFKFLFRIFRAFEKV